jgi:hypothetical protein
MAQPDPLAPVESNTATLRLVRPSQEPTTLLQEYQDTSVLAGISDVGGVWTFVNGVFILLFGANVAYFLFGAHLAVRSEADIFPLTKPNVGRRPLSALGALHIFQRQKLTRKWHEDFPAIQTEGGKPGSETAGIVAFIRERLVDIDDEEGEEAVASGDLEAQKGIEGSTH